MNNSALAVLFLTQLALILGVFRLIGFLAKKVGQPQVPGEMVAGVLLGPSLFGLFLPQVQQQVFPRGVPMDILYVCGQVGLVLHLFLLGVEFETHVTRQHVRSVMVVSLTGLLTSLLLGGLVAFWLMGQPGFFGSRVVPWEAMLFLGMALAITAFPMLTRLLMEHGLATSSLGTLVVAAGSAGDAISWGILVVVLALFKGNATLTLLTIVGGIGYTLLTLTVGRSLLRPLGKLTEKNEGVTGAMLAVVLVLVMGCAWLTDKIGISSSFGGFLLGMAMPRGFFARRVRFLLRPLVTSFLLPLYFVTSGLNTNVGLLNSWLLWGIAALILVSAVTVFMRTVSQKTIDSARASYYHPSPLQQGTLLYPWLGFTGGLDK